MWDVRLPVSVDRAAIDPAIAKISFVRMEAVHQIGSNDRSEPLADVAKEASTSRKKASAGKSSSIFGRAETSHFFE